MIHLKSYTHYEVAKATLFIWIDYHEGEDIQ